jgi:hypothetical protein
MSQAEAKAIEQIALQKDSKLLRRQADNARGKSELVAKAAMSRLVAVVATHKPGTVEYECWAMINTIEELRRLEGHPAKMGKIRPKISKLGEIAALEYVVQQETDGFAEIIAYGMPELTAEAIVLRFPQHFTVQAQSASRTRLREAGFEVSEAGEVSAAA